ncbi:MAG TPA: tetratricopeptide repeat protein [Planctomycetes bacterium]|nr:tetratricopeptide repeat protein [Fuerstiella sp.]HIK95717.1 tetratricopeptide repeat protein [Planctomycetota bacterium]
MTDRSKRKTSVTSRWKTLFWMLGAAILLSAWPMFDWWSVLPEGRTANYVGRTTCASCHQRQVEQWTGSDHDRAMDLATPEFVLGDFENTQLEHHGVTSRMSHRDDKFFVETEGPDGKTAEFQVDYVFGYQPLQQYLTELDRGHIQVLPVTWDTEKREWFYANPDPPFGPDDPLHWTGSAQNWNHMCADCHTTNFAKDFDVPSDTYHSSWSEMDVSCEACHGPGSIHVELADSKSFFWDRRYGHGLADLDSQNSTTQLEACAPCHAHRQRIHPGFKAGDRFYDHYGLSVLEDHLYHDDGQIDEEVYVFGSFTQSLMYRKGVRCSDCHDPHTTRIRFQGNKLCTQCHLAPKYDSPLHHHHRAETTGAQCVECHMPEKTYMVVDPRRDHSLRIPRPDLTVKIGTPNACNGCHTKPKETPAWAAARIEAWYGPKRRDDPHYGEILHAGHRGDPAAGDLLADLAKSRDVGPIVRATAVSLLGTRYSLEASDKTIERALRHRDTAVRAAAVATLAGRPLNSRQDAGRLRELLVPKLTDRARFVRTEAARVASAYPSELFDRDERKDLTKAIKEYRAGLMMNSDQAGAHLSLGILEMNLGDVDSAVKSYRNAMRLDPAVVGPRSNLAQLLTQLGQDDEARQLQLEEVELLKRDAALLPEHAVLQYRLGLLQYLLGREQEAEKALAAAAQLEPQSADFQMALTLLYEKHKRWPEAQRAVDRLIAIQPDNPMFQQIRVNIQRAAASSAVNPSAPSKD